MSVTASSSARQSVGNMAEADLLTALKQRSPQAFSALFDTWSDKLFRLATGILEDDAEAEGVVQETFLKFFEKLEQFEPRAKVSTWLYRVAYNASIDKIRKRRPAQMWLGNDDGDGAEFFPGNLADWRYAPEAWLSSLEAQRELTRAISALPEKQRLVFRLRELDGFSTAETAEILGISVGSVKVRLHRARLLLRETLADYFSERMKREQLL